MYDQLLRAGGCRAPSLITVLSGALPPSWRRRERPDDSVLAPDIVKKITNRVAPKGRLRVRMESATVRAGLATTRAPRECAPIRRWVSTSGRNEDSEQIAAACCRLASSAYPRACSQRPPGRLRSPCTRRFSHRRRSGTEPGRGSVIISPVRTSERPLASPSARRAAEVKNSR